MEKGAENSENRGEADDNEEFINLQNIKKMKVPILVWMDRGQNQIINLWYILLETQSLF